MTCREAERSLADCVPGGLAAARRRALEAVIRASKLAFDHPPAPPPEHLVQAVLGAAARAGLLRRS